MRVKLTDDVKTTDTPPCYFRRGQVLVADAAELKTRGFAGKYERLDAEAAPAESAPVRTGDVKGPDRGTGPSPKKKAKKTAAK